MPAGPSCKFNAGMPSRLLVGMLPTYPPPAPATMAIFSPKVIALSNRAARWLAERVMFVQGCWAETFHVNPPQKQMNAMSRPRDGTQGVYFMRILLSDYATLCRFCNLKYGIRNGGTVQFARGVEELATA